MVLRQPPSYIATDMRDIADFAPSYIEQLITENKQLKENDSQSINTLYGPSSLLPRRHEDFGGMNLTPMMTATTHIPPISGAVEEISVQNPLVDRQARFVTHSGNQVYIGEANCTSFSSRLRQVLLNTSEETHVIRTHFIKDTAIIEACNTITPLPPRPAASILMESAFNTVGQCFHLTRRSIARRHLEKAYQGTILEIDMCTIYALLALGELFSPSQGRSSGSPFPGLQYWANVRQIMRVIPERPSIVHVELSVMTALYSLSVNRRYSAYREIGAALRQSINIGLHQKFKDGTRDAATREHRKRVFWCVYNVDRMIASKSGYPASIQSDEIEVDFPSDEGLTDVERGDLFSADYHNASIRLGRLVGRTNYYVYSRVHFGLSFFKRVQSVFSDLSSWLHTLPKDLELPAESAGHAPQHIIALHLAFNQVSYALCLRAIIHLMLTV